LHSISVIVGPSDCVEVIDRDMIGLDPVIGVCTGCAKLTGLGPLLS